MLITSSSLSVLAISRAASRSISVRSLCSKITKAKSAINSFGGMSYGSYSNSYSLFFRDRVGINSASAIRPFSSTIVSSSESELTDTAGDNASPPPTPRGRKVPARRGAGSKIVSLIDSNDLISSDARVESGSVSKAGGGKLKLEKLEKPVEVEVEGIVKKPRKKRESPSSVTVDAAILSSLPSPDTDKKEKSIGITKTERHAKKSASNNSSSSSSNSSKEAVVIDYGWNWVPPSKGLKSGAEENMDDLFPVLPGVLLTFEEVQAALTRLGGENIVQVELKRPVDDLNQLIIVTGNSTRHLQKMAEVVVKSLKARKLRQAPGYTGAEGAPDDDWVIVDCFNFAVSLMLTEARQAFNLESFSSEADDGSDEYIPKSAKDDKNYDAEFEKWLEKYPNNFYDKRPINKDKEADEPGGFHKL